MTEFLIYERLDYLQQEIHTLSQELQKALEEIRELKQRICDDDCR